jgi:nucleoredoxin
VLHGLFEFSSKFYFFSFIRCGPCCAFTPKLIKFYKKHAEGKNLEIIFIGSDEDEESFDEYYKKMP